MKLTGHLCEAQVVYRSYRDLVKNPKHIWIGQSKNTNSCILVKNYQKW